MSAARIPCVCGGVWSDDNDPDFKAEEAAIDGVVRGESLGKITSSPFSAIPFGSGFCVIKRDIALTHLMMSGVEQILADPCPKVRAAAAQNFVISPSRLGVLLSDESFEVRQALWERRDLSDDMRAMLGEEFS